ncbi:MAG: DUF6538 domain-containing protein [Candidatus Electronema sp. V4]|uniref:DUF6538 domain-containing protein n=1 Tax=Candidatus Electronema sp. V4 TaxID=3454756 RepID=UPI00405597AF
MPAVPSYLMSRHGVWYFNYRIPALIRKKYGITKQFIRKSLRTDNVYEAVKLSRKYTSLLMSSRSQGSGLMKISGQINSSDQERILMLTEGSQDILDYALDIGKKIAECYSTNEINRSYTEQTEFWKQYSEYEYECYRLTVDKFNTKPLPKTDSFGIVINDTHCSSNDEKSITLNDLIEKFLEYKENRWSMETENNKASGGEAVCYS